MRSCPIVILNEGSAVAFWPSGGVDWIFRQARRDADDRFVPPLLLEPDAGE